MQNLSDNWFIEPVFDYEYKTYQVLGYARDAQNHFAERRFYPYFDDLSRHFERLREYVRTRDHLEEKLRTAITDIDLANFRILREPLADPQGVVSELKAILDFALSRFGSELDNARTELEAVRQMLHIEPLGLTGPDFSRGLLLFRESRSTRIYTYHSRLIRRPSGRESYKALRTCYVQTVSTGMFTNFNEVKWEMVKKQAMDTGSNAFLVQTQHHLPHHETVLPLVKSYVLNLL